MLNNLHRTKAERLQAQFEAQIAIFKADGAKKDKILQENVINMSALANQFEKINLELSTANKSIEEKTIIVAIFTEFILKKLFQDYGFSPEQKRSFIDDLKSKISDEIVKSTTMVVFFAQLESNFEEATLTAAVELAALLSQPKPTDAPFGQIGAPVIPSMLGPVERARSVNSAGSGGLVSAAASPKVVAKKDR